MKSLLSIGLAFTAITLIAQEETEDLRKKGLVAHEWGTFTTLHASNGEQLPGLYLEEEKLPNFVESHNLPGKIADKVISQKGSFVDPQNVTVKMETPVIYFYHPKGTEVSVRADFPNGSISQWYPKRSAGDRIEEGAEAVDFAQAYGGWIKWQKVMVLSPKDASPLTQADSDCTPTWLAPRNTSSNKISVDGVIEKYLFYRGIGNFKIPLSYTVEAGGKLSITNTADMDIPYVFVYEKKESGEVNISLAEGMRARQKIVVNLNDPIEEEEEELFYEFREKLIDHGLYEDEADAMLETWKKSYFETPGLRVFWIVPNNLLTTYLKLQISPMPLELNRVFVGRSDLMTPEFETELVEAFKTDGLEKKKNHRYFIAYQTRAAQLAGTESRE